MENPEPQLNPDPLPRRIEQPGIRGWLHMPATVPSAAIALTHGAGSNCEAALLIAVALAFANTGYCVLRYDLPFRQARASGAPVGGKPGQARDRGGIRQAAEFLRDFMKSVAPSAPLYLSGHSYGGRQSSMLVAEHPAEHIADALLLLSYPLHPPGQPDKLRTEHFPALRIPTLFISGNKDEFGTVLELDAARKLIPARTELKLVDRAKHGLDPKLAASIAEWFQHFVAQAS